MFHRSHVCRPERPLSGVERTSNCRGRARPLAGKGDPPRFDGPLDAVGNSQPWPYVVVGRTRAQTQEFCFSVGLGWALPDNLSVSDAGLRGIERATGSCWQRLLSGR